MENEQKIKEQLQEDLRKTREELAIQKWGNEKTLEGMKVLAKELVKYKLAVDNTTDQVIITDPEGTVIYGNAAVEQNTGYTIAETIGKKSGSLWKAPMPLEYYKNFWDTIKTKKQTFIGEIQNKRKNGEIYTAVISVSPILDNSGNILYFVGVERDISKDKAIDKAKTEFVSLASHQLRTPLSAVKWYTEMLLDGDAGKLNKEQTKYLKEVYSGGQRMVALVSALLNVSRIDLGAFIVEPEPTDVVALTKSVIAEQQPEIIADKIKLTTVFKKNIPLIQADPKLLRIVVQNLLSNSVKFTPPRGKVRVSISVDEKNVLIEVSDTGYGIPANQQDKIFTKLFRGDNIQDKNTEGTGLGLYLVKSIIEHTGGSVRFTSTENKGTTFFITLPLAGMEKSAGAKQLS